MKNVDLLTQLLDDMRKSSKLNVDYTISEKQIIDGCLMNLLSKDTIEINYQRDIVEKKIKYPFDLEDLELLGECINCSVCSAYTRKKEIVKLIEGYVDSTIVICRIDKNIYKIDSTLLQLDPITNVTYETNMQCKIILIGI